MIGGNFYNHLDDDCIVVVGKCVQKKIKLVLRISIVIRICWSL